MKDKEDKHITNNKLKTKLDSTFQDAQAPKLEIVCKSIHRYINNNFHLARKSAQIFVRGHYLFREANSFRERSSRKNVSFEETDNVQGQISEHIFAPNGGYRLYYPSNLFRNACSFENWGIFSDIPQF